jgi:hypothetical protein
MSFVCNPDNSMVLIVAHFLPPALVPKYGRQVCYLFFVRAKKSRKKPVI